MPPRLPDNRAPETPADAAVPARHTLSIPFTSARARFVVPIAIGGIPLAYAVAYLAVPEFAYEDAMTWQSGLGEIAVFAAVFAVVRLTWFRARPSQEVFGAAPDRRTACTVILLGVPLVALSYFLLYLVYYPLSYVAPGYVEAWLLDVAEDIVPMSRPHAWLINLEVLILYVVAAPVLEELVFRGLLLGRLAVRFGAAVAIWLPSALFAFFHSDILGALLFGVFMAWLRIRYDSLVPPVLAHAGNNLVVYCLVFTDVVVLGAEVDYSMETFRSELWIGLAGLAVAAPWLLWYYRRALRGVQARFRQSIDDWHAAEDTSWLQSPDETRSMEHSEWR